MKPLVILVPIYRPTLLPLEHYSLTQSLVALAKREVRFIGPEQLDLSYYHEHFPGIPFTGFAAASFDSVQGYSRLLLSQSFYQLFADYEFLLILQTDAIVLRDELDHWCAQVFDYVGAPWPNGYELFVNMGKFGGANGKQVKVPVGNGGLSLRRIHKCIALLAEFDGIVSTFDRTGSSEDLFFSVMGALSENFVMPNEITASLFSVELKPSYYFAVNGGRLPMGTHAWWTYEPEFWLQHLPGKPPLQTPQ